MGRHLSGSVTAVFLAGPHGLDARSCGWPGRDLHLNPLPYRSLQFGLGGEAAVRYADEWIVGVEDVTPLAAEIHALVRSGETERAAALLPEERPFPLGDEVLGHLRA